MPKFARLLAEERPAEVALRDPYRTMTCAQVDEALNRVSNGLRALDLGPDKRIVVGHTSDRTCSGTLGPGPRSVRAMCASAGCPAPDHLGRWVRATGPVDGVRVDVGRE